MRRKWWIVVVVGLFLLVSVFLYVTQPWLEPLHSPSWYMHNTPGQPDLSSPDRFPQPPSLAIMVESNTVEAGSSFLVLGSHFKPKQVIFVDFEYDIINMKVENIFTSETDENGSFYITLGVPENVIPGDYEIKISTGTDIEDRQLLTNLTIHVIAP